MHRSLVNFYHIDVLMVTRTQQDGEKINNRKLNPYLDVFASVGNKVVERISVGNRPCEMDQISFAKEICWRKVAR